MSFPRYSLPPTPKFMIFPGMEFVFAVFQIYQVFHIIVRTLGLKSDIMQDD